MADFRTYTHQFISDFISMYHDNPALWKVKSSEYLNRNTKNKSYGKLLKLVQKVDGDADINAVKRKINTLRACFRKERKKIQLAAETGEIYRPKLWYYNLLYFLDEQDEPMPSSSSNVKDEDSDDDYDDHEDDIENKDDAQHSDDNTTEIELDPYPSQSSPTPLRSESRKRKLKNIKEEEPVSIGKMMLTYSGGEDDEFDAIGRNVAAKLRRLPDSMKIIAEKLLNEVLFKAQVNTLTVSSVVTSSPEKMNLK